jgi:hypothetical protein
VTEFSGQAIGLDVLVDKPNLIAYFDVIRSTVVLIVEVFGALVC